MEEIILILLHSLKLIKNSNINKITTSLNLNKKIYLCNDSKINEINELAYLWPYMIFASN